MKRSNTQSKYTEIRTVRSDQAEKPQSSKARQLTDRMITVFLVGVLAVGIGLLAYPSFSDYWNSFHQSRAVMSYAEQVADMNTEEYGIILDAAHAYNERLAENGINWVMSDEERQSYEEQLNVSGNGVMGYIKIQKIDVTLPIYHGTDESVLQSSIGHLEQSSLPVGGESTHCLLSGHRGIVEPDDLSHLEIEKGQDYCTLITCTPYGINTHRLLVRAHRTENANGSAMVVADAIQIRPIYIAPFIAVPILVILLIYVLISTSLDRRRRRNYKEEYLEENGLKEPEILSEKR